MPSQIAGILFAGLVLGLFLLERRRAEKVSPAIWISVTYLFLIASRPLSMWLGMAPDATPEQLADGSPIDRAAYLALEILGAFTLLRRRATLLRVARGNPALLVFIAYCGVSAVWSEVPDLALKRWFKFLADLIMVLVILTDRNPMAAFRRSMLWLSFLLIPVSVAFIKYFPELGKGYDPWSGMQYVHGVTTGKNVLGAVCLYWGLPLVWVLTQNFRGQKFISWLTSPAAIVFPMAMWLLSIANSATSMSCFAAGAGLIVWILLCGGEKRPLLTHLMALGFVAGTFSVLFLDLGSFALGTLQRDATLTGRTELWQELFELTNNPVLGTGFESFWTGERLRYLWSLHWWQPTQAHNGYIEVYLNLGMVGVALLLATIATTYWQAMRAIQRRDPAGAIRFAYVIVTVVYNYTEASFRMQNFAWLFLLFAAVGFSGEPQRVKPGTRARAGKPASATAPWAQPDLDFGQGTQAVPQR